MKSKKLCSIIPLVIIVLLTSCFVAGCISTYYPINDRISDGIGIGVFDLNDEQWQYRVWVGDSNEPIAQGYHTGNGLYFLPGDTTDVIKMGVTFQEPVTASYELDTPEVANELREKTLFNAGKELYLIYNPTSGIAVVTENFYEVTKEAPAQISTPEQIETQEIERTIIGEWYCTNDGYYDKYLRILDDNTANYKTVGLKGQEDRESNVKWKKNSNDIFFLWGFSQAGYYKLSNDGLTLTYGAKEDGSEVIRTYVKLVDGKPAIQSEGSESLIIRDLASTSYTTKGDKQLTQRLYVAEDYKVEILLGEDDEGKYSFIYYTIDDDFHSTKEAFQIDARRLLSSIPLEDSIDGYKIDTITVTENMSGKKERLSVSA